ncbi:MAG: ASPIC/UnbV domain protein [Planctomycetaceae bacterium]|nr:ASPIC/UnbV domain protein [Planctomycetaceae bacterium]
MNHRHPTDSAAAPGDDVLIGHALQRSLWLAACLVAGAALWWYGWGGSRRPPLDLVRRVALEPPPIPATQEDRPSPFVFRDVTEKVGLGAIIPNGARGEKLLPETMAGGCVVFDYNSDGAPDVLTIGNSPWQDVPSESVSSVRLYQNDGAGQFVDVTRAAGLELTLHGMGAAAADYNHDGQIDLFLTCVGPNRLLCNRGGWFEDVTDVAGVAGDAKAWSTGCGWWDFDRDGDLDLFVANYVAWSRELDLQLDCTVTGTGRSYCRPELFAGSHLYLYRNDGGGHFTDVSQAAGLVVRDRNTGSLLGKSLGMVAIDVDLDGWLDVVVSNDSTPNFVFHNQRNGTFREIGANCGLGFDPAGLVRRQFGVDAAWLPESGGWGVACGTATGEALAFFRAAPGLLQFTDDAVLAGFGQESRVSQKLTPLLCDFDLDGRLDLVIANGQIDAEAKHLRSSQSHAQTPYLYWNVAGGQFRRISTGDLGAAMGGPLIARGAALADFDGDADPDLLLATNGGGLRLLRNEQQSGNHWFCVRAEGAEAVGARVELTAGGVKQVWLANPHRGYLSQSELTVTFGLGATERVERLAVYWANGEIWVQTDLPVNQVLVLSRRAAHE